MLLVRTVFEVEWGKKDAVLAGTAQLQAITAALGVRGRRTLTDLCGPRYTIIQEAVVTNFDQWLELHEELVRNPEWQTLATSLPDVFAAGRTEFYTICNG